MKIRILKRLVILCVAFLLALGLITGCSQPEQSKDEKKPGDEKTEKKTPVRVASYLDAEADVLGNMVLIMFEQNGIPTVDKTKFGTPDVCRNALLQGEIDLLITYTGSGQYWFNDYSDDWRDAEKGYEKVKELDKEKNNIIWLTPAPANNTDTIATRKEIAEKYNLKTWEDFARYVNEGNPVKLIASQSFIDEEFGLFEKAYGFKLDRKNIITLSHGNTSEMLKALANGTNGVNFSLCYTTDGQVEELGLVVLEDPESVPPVYLPCPAVRGEIYEMYPEMKEILKPVFESLDAPTLRKLNKQVAFDGKPGKEVAMQYLKEKDFIK